MKLHQMNLGDSPFEKILSGEKTIELRLNDEKRSLIEIGDLIDFTNTKDTSKKIIVKVIDLYKFNDFKDLYNKLPLDKCGYAKEEVLNAHPDDMLSYYSREKQVKYGVLGIEIIIKK